MTDVGSAFGIHAVGAYAPQYRIAADEFAEAWRSFEASGIEETAVPDADEDVVTMAAEAAQRALDAGDVAGGDVASLAFATTTPPLEEEELTPRLASLLGVPESASLRTHTSSTRAGTRALAEAVDAGSEVGLAVAADCPRGEPYDEREHAAGAGAAAFVVGPDAPAVVEQSAEYAEAYPGTRFRERGRDRVDSIDAGTYDRQAFVEPLAGAAGRVDVGDVDAAAVQSPDGKLPYRAAGSLGISTETIAACETVSELGDTGAASVPLGLGRALADDRERVLAAGWGSGAGADALVVQREDDVPTALSLDGDEDVTYAEYLRLRGEITAEEPAGGGAYVPVPTWKRSLPQRHRLVAGRCPACDAYTFPPDGACTGCNTLVEFERVELSGEGTVEAYTEIGRGGAPPEFNEQQSRSGAFGVAIVAFDAPGGAATAPAQVVDETEVGVRVEAVPRRIYRQEGVTRYGCKVQPVE
jgi:hydroxymethylglutaryl-CoA synthase